MTDALERFVFLAQAGEVLASSLDYEQTLQDVARLAVPTLADVCIVDIVENGALRRVATAHVAPEKRAVLEELRQRFPPSADSPQPAARVMRSGQPELLESVTPDVVASHTRNDDHARLIRAIGMRSHIAVPLVARGTTVGVISFGISESDRRYGPQDVAFAQDLARRAALAIDNARLYQFAHAEIDERQRAEEAARLSEERFRAIMEQSPLSTQIFARTGETLRVNRAWEELWGVTLEQLAGYNILADPQLEPSGIAALLRRAAAGEAVHLPLIRYDPNETIPEKSRHADPARWVRAFAYPVKDASGMVREVVLVHEDVTEARAGQEKLRLSEDRLQRALAAGRMNVWDWDLERDVVECSDNAREFWGIDVGSASDFLAVVHPDDHALLSEAARAAVDGDGHYDAEYRLVDAAGGIRWVQSRGRVERTPDGRPSRLLGVTVDVMELKTAQETTRLLADAGETLGASLDYQSTLQNLARVVVPRLADWCAVDLVTESGTLERVSVHHPDPARVTLANDLFTRYPPPRSSGRGVWHVIDTGQPEWLADLPDEFLEQGAQDAEHLAILRGLGLRSYICVPLVARGATIGALTLVRAETGRPYQQSDVALATDVARRAAAAVDNAQLYQRLRMEDRRKDEFLATLAHELRNPLAPIRTGLSLLQGTKDRGVVRRTHQIMDRQLEHMVRLIDDLLDLSRVTRGKVQLERERVDLRSMVGTAIEASRPLIDDAGIELVVRLPDTPVIVDADRMRISQVVSNLLNNAAKFTERGGRVELDVVEEGAHVEVRVTDTGVGIPKQMLTHIFEMFAQVGDNGARTQSGLGIGLTLVKRLVELHGGQVWADSDGPGAGSTFVVRLPRAGSAEVDAEQLQGAASAGSSQARRVLVVDDNADAAEMLATLLSMDGHDVRTAASGPAALEILNDFHPHIAFLDIGLPGMSGYELARRIRSDSRLAGITLIAVTGWGQDEDRRQSKEAGMDHHLTKPVDTREVQAFVAQS
jgi:PAS domain S-box-containing protein